MTLKAELFGGNVTMSEKNSDNREETSKKEESLSSRTSYTHKATVKHGTVGFIIQTFLVMGVIGFFAGDIFNISSLHPGFILAIVSSFLVWKFPEFEEAFGQNQVPTCPNCQSNNIQIIGQHKKGFSVGKAAGGAILFGGVGALAGLAGKKTNKVDAVCMNCGRKFRI